MLTALFLPTAIGSVSDQVALRLQKATSMRADAPLAQVPAGTKDLACLFLAR